VLDEHRRKALLVLDFHAVENTAIGVDADEELFGWFEIAKDLSGVGHKQLRDNQHASLGIVCKCFNLFFVRHEQAHVV